MPSRSWWLALPGGAGSPAVWSSLSVVLWRSEPSAAVEDSSAPPLNKLVAWASDLGAHGGSMALTGVDLWLLWVGHRGGGARICRWISLPVSCSLSTVLAQRLGSILVTLKQSTPSLSASMGRRTQGKLSSIRSVSFPALSLRSSRWMLACWSRPRMLLIVRELCSGHAPTGWLLKPSSFHSSNPSRTVSFFFEGLEEDKASMEMSMSGIRAAENLSLLVAFMCSTGGNFYGTKNISRVFCWMRMLLQNFYLWHPNSSCELQLHMLTCQASIFLSTIGRVNYASLPFGTCRRRVRASLLRFLRFNGKEPPNLSSVKHPPDLQLSSIPHKPLPTQWLVEPLAL